MGEHKRNPTAIAAKNGELLPKDKGNRLSKRHMDSLMRKKLQDVTGIHALVKAMGGDYFYI